MDFATLAECSECFTERVLYYDALAVAKEHEEIASLLASAVEEELMIPLFQPIKTLQWLLQSSPESESGFHRKKSSSSSSSKSSMKAVPLNKPGKVGKKTAAKSSSEFQRLSNDKAATDLKIT